MKGDNAQYEQTGMILKQVAHGLKIFAWRISNKNRICMYRFITESCRHL